MQPSEKEVLLSMFFAVMLVAAIIGSFLFILLRMDKSRFRLARQREEASLAVAEQERQLIALDLHDDLSPILTAARYKLDSIIITDEHGKRMQAEASDHLQLVVQRIRQWADRLAPASVLQQSPFHHLSEFAGSLAGSGTLNIEIRYFDCPALSSEQSMHLHRMLQEIIHNAVKHSGATGMSIYGTAQEKQLTITAIDDGKGFNVRQTERRTSGTGLHNLRTRARMLKAKLSIVSSPGEGTRHTIVLPL